MGDLFGLGEHELRHESEERHIRTLFEEVARVAIDVAALRGDLARLGRVVEGKVSAEDIDPTITGLDAGLTEARSRLAAAQSASEDAWSETYAQLESSIDDVRRGVEAASIAYSAETDQEAS